MEFNQICQLILNHFSYENDKYLNFYTKRSAHSFVTTSDLMMEEVIRFFDFGNFNVNIFDLLIQIAADALNLDIYIIQNSEGIVQILKVPGGNFTKKVYLKYTHDNKYLDANHYVPLIKYKKLYPTKPWPNGFIVIPGYESSQYVPMDLSTLQVESNEDSDEQPSCPQNIFTPEHSYCKSPQYTPDQCDEDIENQTQEETQSNVNENTEQHSTIVEYVYQVSENYENEAECKGSWVCPNGNCGFLKTSKNKQLNYVNWTYLQHNEKEKICSMCNCNAVREQCGARKLVDYDIISHIAVVYHIGCHKCHKKLDFQMRHQNIQARTQEFTQKGGTASLAGKIAVGNLIIQGKVKEAQLETHNWIDKRMMQRIFHEQQETHSVDENSFDAVGILKRALDEGDEFYVYRINNCSLNGSSDYVFKTSFEMALRAIRMDINGEEYGLQKENAYFNVTHTRVHRFKSFALWLIHGHIREMLRLASMEMRTENTHDISIFFTLFNQVLEKVSGIEGYKFNPQCFMCDEGGANYRAVRDVY